MGRSKLLKGAAYFLYASIFLLFFVVLFFNIPGVYVFSIPKQVLCFVLGEILFIGTFFLAWNKLKTTAFFAQFQQMDRPIIVASLFVLFIIQLLFVSQFYTQTGYDGFLVYRAGTNDTLWGLESAYFSSFPNNFLLLFLTHGIDRLNAFLGGGLNVYWVLVVINIIAVDTAIYLVYAITKKIFSHQLAVNAFVLAVVLLGLSPWLTSFYSDTLSMPIGLLVFYLYLKIKDETKVSRQLLYGVALGSLLYFGFLIKPSAIFSGIAIIIIEVLMCNYKNFFKNIKKIVLCSSLTIAVVVGVYAIRLPYDYIVTHQNIVPYDANENFPFTHWMMIGMVEAEYRENVIYGMITIEDYRLTQSIPGKEAKQKKNIEVIKERLKNFGVIGYLGYLWKKVVWIFGDGTFFWGNEGPLVEPTQVSGVGQVIQNVVYPTGAYYGYYVYLLQTVWFIVLFALGMSVFWLKKYMNKEFFIVSCTIFGSIVFILLFEGRSRYLMNNLGFYIIIASIGVQGIMNFIKKRIII